MKRRKKNRFFSFNQDNITRKRKGFIVPEEKTLERQGGKRNDVRTSFPLGRKKETKGKHLFWLPSPTGKKKGKGKRI